MEAWQFKHETAAFLRCAREDGSSYAFGALFDSTETMLLKGSVESTIGIRPYRVIDHTCDALQKTDTPF